MNRFYEYVSYYHVFHYTILISLKPWGKLTKWFYRFWLYCLYMYFYIFFLTSPTYLFILLTNFMLLLFVFTIFSIHLNLIYTFFSTKQIAVFFFLYNILYLHLLKSINITKFLHEIKLSIATLPFHTKNTLLYRLYIPLILYAHIP